MLNAFLLFAEDEAPKGGAADFFSTPLFPMLLVMGVFFLLIVLPSQRRQKKEREALLANLKKNDEVVTAAGIIGVVTHIKDGGDEVTLRSDDTRIRVLRSSIVRIMSDEKSKDGAASASANTTK